MFEWLCCPCGTSVLAAGAEVGRAGSAQLHATPLACTRPRELCGPSQSVHNLTVVHLFREQGDARGGKGGSKAAGGKPAPSYKGDRRKAGDVGANAHDVEEDDSGRKWVRDRHGKRIGVAPGARRERRGVPREGDGGGSGFDALASSGGGGRRRAGVAEEAVAPWHERSVMLSALPPSKSSKLAAKGRQPSSRAEMDAIEERITKAQGVGDKAIEFAARAFERDRGNESDLRWLRKVRQAGTSADKVAAATLLVQQSPEANIAQLDSLLSMAASKGHRDTAAAVDALGELFGTALLPDDRALRPFATRDVEAALAAFDEAKGKGLGADKEARGRIMLWRLEDMLRSRYARFVTSLDELSTAQLPFLKERAVKAAYTLLLRKPEQERALLRLLVNKLGDPERKVASKAGYLLHSLLTEHPAMQQSVVMEVENFCFRPGISSRAQYYAAVFLNQLVLSHRDDGPAVAKRLVTLYFALFKAQLERATSGAEERAEASKAKAKEKARKAKAKGKRAPKRALEAARDAAKKASAPLEAAVDARVLTALLSGVNRAFPYVAEAEAETLVDEHSPTLYKLSHSASFGAVTQSLALLFKLMESRGAVSDRFYRALYAAVSMPAMSTSVKAPLFLALFLRAASADASHARMAAFAKRLLQACAGQRPEFVCGCLLVLSTLFQRKPALWTAILQPEAGGEEDELERFGDDDGDEGADAGVHKNGDADGEADLAEGANGSSSRGVGSGYDPVKREPLYARAEGACAWELSALAQHVHPSVAAMARTLLAGAPVQYAGDPTTDLALAPFLDKFLHKAPRALREGRKRFRGASVMQRVSGVGGLPRGELERSAGGVTAASGAAALAAAREEDVAPGDRFFHRFMQLKKSGKQQRDANRKKRQEALEAEHAGAGVMGDDDDDTPLANESAFDSEDDADDIAVGDSGDSASDSDGEDDVAIGADDEDDSDYDVDVAVGFDEESEDDGDADDASDDDEEYDDAALMRAMELDEDAIDIDDDADLGDGLGDLDVDISSDEGGESDFEKAANVEAAASSDDDDASDTSGDEPWLSGGSDDGESDGDEGQPEDKAKGSKRARADPFASADDFAEAIDRDEYIGKPPADGSGSAKRSAKRGAKGGASKRAGAGKRSRR